MFRSSGVHDLTGGPARSAPAAISGSADGSSAYAHGSVSARGHAQHARQSRAEAKLEASLKAGRAGTDR